MFSLDIIVVPQTDNVFASDVIFTSIDFGIVSMHSIFTSFHLIFCAFYFVVASSLDITISLN